MFARLPQDARAEARGSVAKASGQGRTVSRVAAVLRAFTVRRPFLTLTEVARTTGLDKVTARRLLLSLRDEGLIHQDPQTKRYAISLGMLELSSAAPHGSALKEAAAPWVLRLATEAEATAMLSLHESDSAVCIDRTDLGPTVQFIWRVGSRLPLNVGAAPKTILSHLPDDDSERVLGGTLDRFTRHSLTDPAALRRRLREIRERGWEVAVEEVTLGLTGVAVPLFDRHERFVGALSLAGQTDRMLEGDQPRYLQSLKKAAEEIGARIEDADTVQSVDKLDHRDSRVRLLG